MGNRLEQIAVVAGWAFLCAGSLPAAEPAKATHTIEPVLLEVAPARPNGDAWDSGFGAFTRPDPQVTLMRRDEPALREATAMLVAAQEKRFKELGQPAPPQAKALMARSALQVLSCGVTVEALQDEDLTKVRGRLFADSQVAKDTILAKLAGAALPVAAGDKVTIYVNDIDVAAHDLMGETEFEITKELLDKGELELKFNAVESLRLRIKPLPK